MTADVFQQHLDDWARWQRSPWGSLRYRLVAQLLARHLTASEPFTVLDLGGGDGADSVPLAAAGHDVVVADQSPGLLARARSRAAEARTTVRTVVAALDRPDGRAHLRATLPDGADLVLSHNVVQYLPDVETAVADAVSHVRHGGLVSLMATNPVNQVLSAAVRGLDPQAALALLDAPTVRAVTFEHDVRRIPWQDGERALRAAGCEPVARYGVLCVNHLITADDRKHEPDFAAALERLELAVADRDPYRDVAAMWMLVARRG
jgi:S-adenosylmethionine-dependent methyltransferase